MLNSIFFEQEHLLRLYANTLLKGELFKDFSFHDCRRSVDPFRVLVSTESALRNTTNKPKNLQTFICVILSSSVIQKRSTTVEPRLSGLVRTSVK